MVKSGRTHLMDATPVTLGQEFGGYAAAGRLRRSSGSRRRCPGWPSCRSAAPRSAPGSTRPPGSPRAVIALTRRGDRAAADRGAQPLRGAGRPGRAGRGVRRAADDRGRPEQDRQRHPLDGFRPARRTAARSALPDLQPGSSIMPGKVNPVICEAVRQVVRAGDRQRRGRRLRRGGGQLRAERDAAGDGPQRAGVDPAAGQRRRGCSPTAASTASRPTSSAAASYAESSPSIVTPLNRYIGYDEAAKVAKQALAERQDDPPGRDRARLRRVRQDQRRRLDGVLDVLSMTQPRE